MKIDPRVNLPWGSKYHMIPGSNKINRYLPKFNANDSDYLKYGFGRVKLNDIK